MLKKKYKLKLNEKWCKGCGICVGFCPAHILSIGLNGKLKIEDDEKCLGCGQCQLRCPDFAIEVEEV
jgi:2-oxoglutarate ferredoxin oxidoreductase subunit delta